MKLSNIFCVINAIQFFLCLILFFFQSRMAVFSAQHAKPFMGKKRAPSLLGRWSTTSSPTACPATQTPKPSASSMTFLPGSRSELSHFDKSTMLLLRPDLLSLLYKSVPCLQLLLIRLSLMDGYPCRKVKLLGLCESLRKRHS